MSELSKNEFPLSMQSAMKELQKNSDFEIKPCDITNIEDNPKYKKLTLTTGQKMRMSSFASQLPMMSAALNSAEALSKAGQYNYYMMTVPKGIPYTLMNLKGGFGNTLIGTDGKFAMQVPLQQIDITQKLTVQTAALTTFTIMSIATSQYFLSQINSKLNVMKMDIDKILEFLYDDKKAELISEVNFTRYVYQNYSTIMSNESQKIATIASLQEARKVAMKDCEFYLNDLSHTVNKKNEVANNINKAFKLKDVLDLSMNLYLTSMLLEVYYAQNFDGNYLAYVEKSTLAYIDKCEKMMIEMFGALKTNINNGNGENMFYKIPDKDKHLERIDKLLESLHDSGSSEMRKMLSSSLHMPTENKVYYLNAKGEVYVKTA